MPELSLNNTRRNKINIMSGLKTPNNVIYALRKGKITQGNAKNRGKNFITANALEQFSKKFVNFSKTRRGRRTMTRRRR